MKVALDTNLPVRLLTNDGAGCDPLNAPCREMRPVRPTH